MPSMLPGPPFAALFYKHFQKFVPGQSHIGLGNNAMFTAKVLEQNGIKCRPYGIKDINCIKRIVQHAPGITHAVIEGTFLSPADVLSAATQFDMIKWSCREHSQITFLGVQNKGIQYTRGYGYLHDQTQNFTFSANVKRFADTWVVAYNQPCLLLPNLYPLDANPAPKNRQSVGTRALRISGFGAGRILKNLPGGAMAALNISRILGRDVEYHINVGREPNLDKTAIACMDVFANVPGCKVVTHQWASWAEFRHWCGLMDLGLAPTFTETFCLTAADHIAAGVPVVGTNSIEWLPKRWMADADDPEDIARVGVSLIGHPGAVTEGQTALAAYVANGVKLWKSWVL